MSIANIIRGTSKKYKFLFTNKSTGQPEDITGWKIQFMAKANIDDLDADAVINKIVTAGDDAADDPVNGLMFLTLSKTDTTVAEDTYHYMFVAITPGVTPSITPLDSSTFEITKSVINNAG